MIWGLFRDALLQRRRGFRLDARACVELLQPTLHVIGAENIPSGGCYIITPNHYFRPGFDSQWTALAISACVPGDVHWIMTGELTIPGRWIAPLGRPISRFVLRRIASVYGFTRMPPMPPRASDVAARSAAVRQVLRFVEQAPKAIIGLAPEGRDQTGGRLAMPPSGIGRFCLLLAKAGLKFLPVGVFEGDGALTLSFGPLYTLAIADASSPLEADRLAARTVMAHIAPLLPLALQGSFSPQAASTTQENG